MKKIILICNGGDIANLMRFATSLVEVSKLKVLGMFPEVIQFDEMPLRMRVLEGSTAGLSTEVNAADTLHDDINNNIDLFVSICDEKAIHKSIFPVFRPTIDEIAAESRFADYIIFDAIPRKGYVTDLFHERIIKELLPSVECPVIIAPSSFMGLEEVAFWYEGNTSSAFAMKQFAYLRLLSDDIRTTVLTTRQLENTQQGDLQQIREWQCRHFDFNNIQIIDDKYDKGLFDFILRKNKTMLITGAHFRGRLLRFFQFSRTALSIKTLPFPLFITNH